MSRCASKLPAVTPISIERLGLDLDIVGSPGWLRPSGHCVTEARVLRGKSVPNEFAGEQIVVTYDADVCVHAGNCVKQLPAVFDVNKDPWIDPQQASVEDVEAAVNACPSGALGSRRTS